MPGPPLRLTVRDPQGNQRDVRFTEDPVRVGRSHECELELDSGFVSRFHARFERQGAGWQVADQGSKNGVFVNGTRVEGRTPVRPGDTVRVGDFSIVVLEEPAARPPETSPLDDERTMLTPPSGVHSRTGGIAAQPATAQPTQQQPASVTPGPLPRGGAASAAALPVERTEVFMPDRTTQQSPAVVAPAETPAPSGTIAGLSPREQRFVDALRADPQGRTAAELVAAVWGAGEGDNDMLERLAARLRARLEAAGLSLEPLPGGGFRLRGG
ncbi:MAG TPA: FHA domain-containing protein [Dehalococcoidia bacterium]|nr:FHA domain-containing protein [Dehalococcoidia bacterium]